MVRRLVVMLVCVMVAVMGAAAQAPPSGAAPAAIESPYAAALAARVAFAREAYQLGEGDAVRLKAVLAELLPTQELYMHEHAATVRRTKMALHELLPQQNYTPEMREKLEATFKRQLRAMYAEAPLSMTNVIQRVEATLPKGSAAERRASLAQRYSDVLKGQPLDYELLDEAIVRDKHDETQVRPGAAGAASAGRSESARPPDNTDASSTATARTDWPPVRTQPPTSSPPPAITKEISSMARPRPPVAAAPDAEPPPPPPPAPPVAEWGGRFESICTKYGFALEQRSRAEAVWKSCSSRAEAHLQQNRQAFDAANKMGDPAAKEQKLKELSQPLDKLFAEMNQRIESIASIEQKQAAEK